MTGGHVNTGEKTRGRIAAGALLVFVLVAMAMASAAPAASAACPNEAFRTGPSAQLGECRAYEMVTPVDKESGEGVFVGLGSDGAHASPSGDGIFFHSLSAYAAPQSNLYANPYVATRSGEAWGTQAIGGPQANPAGIPLTSVLAVSDDLARAIVGSNEALAPGAIPGGSNLYLRDNRSGAYTLLAAEPTDGEYLGWTNNAGPLLPLAGAVADWSIFLIARRDGLYEFRDGRLSLVAPGARAAGSTEATPNTMSADGSRFYYSDNESHIYLHQQGQEPLLVSEDEGGEPVPSNFVGATPSGGAAFFLTSGHLYRFEASAPPGSRSTQIAPAVGLEGEPTQVFGAFASEDGSTVYFYTNDRLTADAEPLREGGTYLYVWHERPGQPGQLRFITGLNFGPSYVSVSPDGSFLGFTEYGKITPDAVDGPLAACPTEEGRCENVFLYSYGADRTDCASCDGSAPAGRSILGGGLERIYNRTVPRAVLADGTVLFDTPNALSPRDVNGVGDLYSWRDGTRQLISTGTSPDESALVDASPDGSDIFFQTTQSLVGQDIDTNADVYDARLYGGLPQSGAKLTPNCGTESSCRGGTAPGSSSPTPGTSVVRGARNVDGACLALQGKARTARKRAHALVGRAKDADGKRAKALRKAAVREAKAGRRLGRRAHNCTGGGR